MAEPSVDPGYLLSQLRCFLLWVGGGEADSSDIAGAAGEQAEGDGEGGGEPAPLPPEEAGCLVWDAAALPGDAAFLLQHGLPAMLQPVLAAAAVREHWRALEIALGILGNLSCHAGARRQLLTQQGLAELLMDKLLWVDDAAALGELCRCLAGLISGREENEAVEAWWALLRREEAVGRIVWMVEDTLNSLLLERALNLVATMVSMTAAAAAAGGSSPLQMPAAAGGSGSPATAVAAAPSSAQQQQLVPLLLSLDLLSLLASVLNGWCAKVHDDDGHFGSNRGTPGGGAGDASDAVQQPGGHGNAAAVGAAAGLGQQEPGEAAAGASSPVVGPRASEPAAVAAEVTEGAALEALAVLEALLASGSAGEQATSASAAIRQALLRTIAGAEHHSMQALSITLLAALDGVGPELLEHPDAVAVVLGRLALAAEGQQQQGDAASAGEHAAGTAEQRQQAGEEQLEAAWALCSALAHALAQQTPQQQEGTEAVLAVLDGHVDVLCHDWGTAGSGVRQHQAYTLQRLVPLLEARPGATEQQQQALQAALAQCKAQAQL